jgi:SHS2 domain-containing protein
MEKSFKFLEHPADIGIEASGRNLMELFENAAFGLYELMLDIPSEKPEIIKSIKINAIDKEALLVKYLSEILFLFEVDEFIGINIHVLNIFQDENEFNLISELEGIKFQKNIHNFKIGVKAVTFHQLEITDENGQYTLKVFFDI